MGAGNRTSHGQTEPGTSREKSVHHLQTSNDHYSKEYYTDNYQEEQCYSLETQQVHSIHTHPAGKRYFVTLPMQHLVRRHPLILTPNVKLRKSPFLLHPCGNAKPLRPLGKIDLLCERKNPYDTLTFQFYQDTSRRTNQPYYQAQIVRNWASSKSNNSVKGFRWKLPP